MEGLVPPHVDPSPPDPMNDPHYTTNALAGEDGPGDPDTCRICRVEGSNAEPLFHPCKCSGSIKHVHQDCLMEWLSHSQKKHCELCKTPFRFTKLYSPNMPQDLPTSVFLRHSVIHSMRHIGTWLRFCLVATVWLVCLPYVIRQVWKMLFWFSDGGWPYRYTTIDITGNSTEILEMAERLRHGANVRNGTSPATPFHRPTTPATDGSIWSLLVRISETLNISDVDPLATGLFKSLYHGLGISVKIAPHEQTPNMTVADFTIGAPPIPQGPSLLSEVPFLSNMTRSSHVNQLIVTIAEGYVITLLLVVAVILVFLIREWVVQHQFGANVRAGGFNPEVPAPERPREEEPAAPEEEVQPLFIPEAPRDWEHRPIARPRRRNVHFDAEAAPRPTGGAEAQHDQDPEVGPAKRRPASTRDIMDPALEMRRQLAEEPRMTEEFLAIWRRADGDPTEVLRIIEEENKSDEMRYWVNAMKTLQPLQPLDNSRRQPTQAANPPATTNGSDKPTLDPTESAATSPEGSHAGGVIAPLNSDQSSASSDSWEDISKSSGSPTRDVATPEEALAAPQQLNHDLSFNKGKEKEVDTPTSSTQFQGFGSGVSRPRAISDGPPLKDGISMLANNNWSFKNIPDTDTEDARLPSPDLFERPKPAENTRSFGSSTVSSSDTLPAQSSHGSEAWKAAQDLRVQEAIERARESQRLELDPDSAVALDPDFLGPIEVRGLDGIVRTAANFQEVFDTHSVGGSDNDSDDEDAGREINSLQYDAPPQGALVHIAAPAAEPHGLFGIIAEWLWGGVEDVRQVEGANDEHVGRDLPAEAPIVPVQNDQDLFQQPGDFPGQDLEVAEAARAAGIDPNDPDAIDDAEDFDGIMELIGMRGPIFGLAQNALFSAFLLTLTIAIGVWIPYNIGRVSILLIANPGPTVKLPLRLVFWSAAFLQDISATIIGFVSYCLIYLSLWPIWLWNVLVPGSFDMDNVFSWGSAALRLSNDAVERILHGSVNSLLNFKDSDILNFSAASHESLLTLGSLVRDTFSSIGHAVSHIFVGEYNLTLSGAWACSVSSLQGAWQLIYDLPLFLTRPDAWVISLEVSKRTTPLNPDLSAWSGADRSWATLGGYSTLTILGALYLKKSTPFSNGPAGREWEATILDLLHQAGGVMKVILIISIEMLVFPLYCGLLLDAALLPLFDSVTIMSRVQFTLQSPLTSIFIHWFVGTCYMFHFALFVSMCRKIMRKGVLYFIRDPDDPTFHPVRDVLERNVTTQLRKILFSALVYGALVVICLGGVVWGLSYAFRGVLPIHWSSNEPVLEFPIDLLFYNFLMPLAVRLFKPSDGLHAMYSWWFRRCARMLRLTWFLFGKRQQDEEGYTVRRGWREVFRRVNGDPLNMVKNDDPRDPFTEEPELGAYFRQDGRYVRAPASDQVRIPKGNEIFLEVDEYNTRVDGQMEREDGPHAWNSDLYKHVYIPPHFGLRISAFILSIWAFAALTGVCITIVPLVFGRHIFSKMLPSHVRKNDVYAFSIGVYILGSALYGILHLQRFIRYIISSFALTRETPQNALRALAAVTSRVARLLWTYAAFIFLLPTLFAFVVEFYAILPLHTYFSAPEPHTIHFVQSWTLGLLYLKLTSRIILFYSDSRPAISLRAITRDGYLNPDGRLATRAFILPGTVVLGTALFLPWFLAQLAVLTIFRSSAEEQQVLIYRYVYPAVLMIGILCWLSWLMIGMMRVWRVRIKDEVYLIGERLHNFGERKATGNGVGIGVRRIET